MNNYNEMLLRHFSPEGVKLESDPGLAPSPTDGTHISINLGDSEQAVAQNAAIIDNLIKSFSNRGVISTESHDPSSLNRIFGSANNGTENYVVNGVYVPDLFEEKVLSVKVEIVTAKTKLKNLRDDVVYFVIDDFDTASIVLALKERGFMASDTINQLMLDVSDMDTYLNRKGVIQ